MTDATQDEPAALVARLRTAGEVLTSHASAVAAGSPWPLSDDFGVEPESHWGPPETLAHVAEMIPFWMGQIERVLDGDEGSGSEAVPFGRVVTDELRLAVIGRDRELPPRELFGRIASDLDRVSRRLGELRPEDWIRRGRHPRLGDMTVAAIVERFLASHLEEHARQLSDSLAAKPGPE